MPRDNVQEETPNSDRGIEAVAVYSIFSMFISQPTVLIVQMVSVGGGWKTQREASPKEIDVRNRLGKLPR